MGAKKVKKKIIFFIYYIAITSFLITLTYYQTSIHTVILKTIVSSSFLAVAIANYKNNKPHLILIGLGFCWIGDVVLSIQQICLSEKVLILGMMAFLLGNIFFILSTLKQSKIKLWEFLFPLVMFAFMLVISKWKMMDFRGILPYSIIYCIFISWNCTRSLSNYLQHKNKTRKIFCLGLMLFFISDFVLMFKMFYLGRFVLGDFLNLSIYYTSVLLIAYSLEFKEENI